MNVDRLWSDRQDRVRDGTAACGGVKRWDDDCSVGRIALLVVDLFNL